MLSQSRLKELVHYNPDTGVFTRLVTTAANAMAGNIAGNFDSLGYVQICVDGARYRGHRLAWLYMTGEWPKHVIDHIDLNTGNNCWNNLREATRSQNQQNHPMHKNNKVGFKGVTRFQKGYRATIKVRGKQKHLGCFSTPEEAYSAYAKAANELFGEFARVA